MIKDFIRNFRIDNEYNYKQSLIKNLNRLIDKKEIKIIEINKQYKDFDEAIKDLSYLISNDQNIVLLPNDDSNIDLTISKNNLFHSLHKEPDYIKTAVHSELKNLIKTSLFLEKSKPYKKNDNKLEAIYSFGNIIRFRNDLYAVSLKAKHYKSERSKIERWEKGERIDHYNITIEHIKKLPTYVGRLSTYAFSDSGLPTNNVGSGVDRFLIESTKISIIELLKNVKLNKKNIYDDTISYYDFFIREKDLSKKIVQKSIT